MAFLIILGAQDNPFRFFFLHYPILT
jgi:hypothetical protein